MLPLSAENRREAGVTAGDAVDVDVELDTAPREVVVPADLTAALQQDAEAHDSFNALSYSAKRRHILAVESAKTAETRQRRIDTVIASLHKDARAQ